MLFMRVDAAAAVLIYSWLMNSLAHTHQHHHHHVPNVSAEVPS